MTLEEVLDRVADRETFLAFVEVLADEREQAERLEREDPSRYQWGDALGWQNSTISSFLQAALAGSDAQRAGCRFEDPDWKAFAEFLYLGKIYE